MVRMLSINGLSKSFKNNLVLNSVNLELNSGEIFGLLGRNGAGKSTLINIISNIYFPDKGCVNIFNNSDIGVMPDTNEFFNSMTTTQFLKFIYSIKNEHFSEKSAKFLLDNVAMDFEKVKKLRLKQFSFGMRKKISLAQAMIGNPNILILDEPTSGVDPESIIHIHETIRKCRDRGQTVLLTSHNINEIEKLCDQIAIIKKGKIAVQGSLLEIKEQYSQEIVVTIESNLNIKKDHVRDLNNIKITDKNNEFIVANIEDISDLISNILVAGYKLYSVTYSSKSLESIFMEC